jgi:signal transduction histidine kinase
MKVQTATAGVLFLLVLLTWLLLRGVDTNASAYATTLRAFDDLELAEASLRRDVLQARAGLLRDYDGLVKSIGAMEAAIAKLRMFAQMEGLNAGPIDRLTAILARQEELTERFKSANALLQNSLSYVGLLSSTPAFGIRDASLAPETGALAAAILYLTRDTSASAIMALRQRIDRFEAQAPKEGAGVEPARALLAHARLLLQLLPAVDETLRALIAVPSAEALEDVRSMFAARQSAIEETAWKFRFLLYLAALILLVMLVVLSVRLRARERERVQLTLRLERARRMQMVGSLASGIAHNFNNIISAILGYSEMLEPHLARGTKAAHHADEMRKAAERARDLIDSILAFGRPRETSAQVAPVQTLFEDTASLLRASLPAEVELAVGDIPTDIAVSGEPSHLQQVLLNLCNNAAQAMSGKGRIALSAELKDVASPLTLSHGQLAASRYICITVADRGHGFDEKVGRRLFEPFFTTRMAGTGLGLATAREIVESHAGAMNVQSKPGEGSCFEVWLPAAPPGAAAAPAPKQELLGQGETVLLVEGEREYLLRGEEMLAALGYEPIGFGRVADALEACRAAPDRFDIVLVCQASGAGAVIDRARELRAVAPHQPMLFAVASMADVRAERLAEAGILGLVSRPLISAELAASLARCLRPPATH